MVASIHTGQIEARRRAANCQRSMTRLCGVQRDRGEENGNKRQDPAHMKSLASAHWNAMAFRRAAFQARSDPLVLNRHAAARLLELCRIDPCPSVFVMQ